MRIQCSIIALAAATLCGTPALAQSEAETAAPAEQADAAAAEPAATEEASSSSQLQDIVVTAQKRSENLQKVPISVSVATSAQLESAGIEGLQNLKMVTPSVQIANSANQIFPFIRGIGSRALAPGIESPVAIYVDGVYYASTSSTAFSFNNIEQIEVLKGPQGTLFGRNATGGLIQVTTRDPSDTPSGSLELGYGNFQTFKGNAYISGPIAEGVSADLALTGLTMGDGYGKNRFNGEDIRRVYHDIGVRSKWKFDLGPDTEARLIFDYADAKNNTFVAGVRKGTTIAPPFGPQINSDYDISQDVQPIINVRSGGVSLRIDQALGDIKLVSISAYRDLKYSQPFDGDYTAVHATEILVKERDKQFSQEFQLLSPSNQAFQWVLGGYYYWSDSGYGPLALSFFGPSRRVTPLGTLIRQENGTAQTAESLAAFGQGTLEITPQLHVTAGLRYTTEKRELEGPVTQFFLDGTSAVTRVDNSDRFNKLTFRGAIDYQITDNILGYVSFNRGFKSGGFNPAVVALGAFRPEQLDAYEAGLKTTLFDRRLRLNMAVFRYNYSDLQVSRLVNGVTGIVNGGSARTYGLDIDGQAQLGENLTLTFAYNYLNAEYKSFPGAPFAVPGPNGGFATVIGDAAGKRTALSPRNTANLGINYEVPLSNGSLVFGTTAYYSSRFFFEPDNVIEQPKFVTLAGSIKWSVNDNLSFSVWGTNLTNQRVLQNGNITGGLYRSAFEPPRTYGFTLGFKY